MAATWKKVAFSLDTIPKTLLSATGDVIYASDVATPAARHMATHVDGEVLTVASGVPVWAARAAPATHAASHYKDGTDELLLSDFTVTGAVDFNTKQATDLVIHNAATASQPTAVVGKPYFDTTDLYLKICTAVIPS